MSRPSCFATRLKLWTRKRVAAQQPHIKAVPVKTERQQACLALHGMRRQLMKIRIMQTNALRGIFIEFGVALPEGHSHLLKAVQGEFARAQQEGRFPADLVVSVQEQLARINGLKLTSRASVNDSASRFGMTIRCRQCIESPASAI